MGYILEGMEVYCDAQVLCGKRTKLAQVELSHFKNVQTYLFKDLFNIVLLMKWIEMNGTLVGLVWSTRLVVNTIIPLL